MGLVLGFSASLFEKAILFGPVLKTCRSTSNLINQCSVFFFNCPRVQSTRSPSFTSCSLSLFTLHTFSLFSSPHLARHERKPPPKAKL